MNDEQKTVTVTIAGRSYRMACAPGEEEHLTELAAILDQRVDVLRSSIGEIGDMRLHVMAGLTIADELHEARKKIQELETNLHHLDQKHKMTTETETETERQIIGYVTDIAGRLEKLALKINLSPKE